MLSLLRIKNLALVEDLTWELMPGYNTITGETGAGKSILIGALGLVLGERADRQLVRSGAETCSVEAVFAVAALEKRLGDFLVQNGLEPCEQHQLLLKRVFSLSGANRQFVNGSPTTLQNLAALGQWLVDIHGPHDHQSLLHPSNQLSILDASGNLRSLREKFTELLRRRQTLEAEKARLIVDEQTYARQLDLLRFQVQEIKAARLRAGEETDLSQDYERANNAVRLLELSEAARQCLGESEDSLLSQAGNLGRVLQEWRALDPGAARLAETQEQIMALLQDLQADLSKYSDRLELDPSQLAELEQRLNLLQSLKRKYGSTIEAVIQFGEEAQKKLQSLEQRDSELERIHQDLHKLEIQALEVGRELSAKRRKLITPLAQSAKKHLAELGFNHCRFEIALESKCEPAAWRNAPAASGFDSIEFQFAPNAGEPLRPLRAIASSGELARVMLALKTVLAAEDEIPVLVFDEVDANVGGETARSVGQKMRQIAQSHQVICITHLAPVAAAADAHFVVSKKIKEGRTITEVAPLDPEPRKRELARMLGGASEAALRHAEEMLASPPGDPENSKRGGKPKKSA